MFVQRLYNLKKNKPIIVNKIHFTFNNENVKKLNILKSNE